VSALQRIVVLLVVAALAGTGASVAPAAAKKRTFRAASGAVKVTLTFREQGLFSASDLRLTITRSGATVLSQLLRDDRGEPATDRPTLLIARDLDLDGEPEVLVDLYTGGAHCCTYTLLYRFDPTAAEYLSVAHEWGNVGYGLRDVDGDGVPELASADDRFAYAFTSYAGSAFPVQVWRYRPGGLVDVTRAYRQLVRADAVQLWRSYVRERQRKPADRDVRGVLAAWQADKALLGEAGEGWKRLRAARAAGELKGSPPWPSGYRYLRELRAFLAAAGYLAG
jgi:hypothetical protein